MAINVVTRIIPGPLMKKRTTEPFFLPHAYWSLYTEVTGDGSGGTVNHTIALPLPIAQQLKFLYSWEEFMVAVNANLGYRASIEILTREPMPPLAGTEGRINLGGILFADPALTQATIYGKRGIGGGTNNSMLPLPDRIFAPRSTAAELDIVIQLDVNTNLAVYRYWLWGYIWERLPFEQNGLYPVRPGSG